MLQTSSFLRKSQSNWSCHTYDGLHPPQALITPQPVARERASAGAGGMVQLKVLGGVADLRQMTLRPVNGSQVSK
jgi:hypothetical protein